MIREELSDDDIHAMECYADLQPWAISLCEAAYQDSLVKGRRRRAARMDFVPGWKEAARQLGRPDVFREVYDMPEAGRFSIDALAPHMQAEFERAYQTRARGRASREDFLDGFVSALIALRSKSSFKADRVDEVFS